MTRWPGAMPARPTRAASTSSRIARSPASASRTARSSASRPRAAPSRAKKVGCVVAGHCGVLAAMAGFRLPIESHPLQALVSEPIKPVLRLRRHVRRGARLCQPVRQGRAGVRRRHRQLQLLCPARQPAGGRESAERADRAVPDLQPAAHPAAVGRHRRYLPGRQPDHRQDAGREPVLQLRLGHRRLQGDARLRLGLRPHHRDRRAAQAERAVRAGALHHRLSDRRARRRRASRTEDEASPDAADPLPLLRTSATRTSSPTAAKAHIARPLQTASS